MVTTKFITIVMTPEWKGSWYYTVYWTISLSVNSMDVSIKGNLYDKDMDVALNKVAKKVLEIIESYNE